MELSAGTGTRYAGPEPLPGTTQEKSGNLMWSGMWLPCVQQSDSVSVLLPAHDAVPMLHSCAL